MYPSSDVRILRAVRRELVCEREERGKKRKRERREGEKEREGERERVIGYSTTVWAVISRAEEEEFIAIFVNQLSLPNCKSIRRHTKYFWLPADQKECHRSMTTLSIDKNLFAMTSRDMI